MNTTKNIEQIRLLSGAFAELKLERPAAKLWLATFAAVPKRKWPEVARCLRRALEARMELNEALPDLLTAVGMADEKGCPRNLLDPQERAHDLTTSALIEVLSGYVWDRNDAKNALPPDALTLDKLLKQESLVEVLRLFTEEDE